MYTINNNDKTNNNSFFIARIGLFAALAVILSYVEYLLPINIGVPGAKPGFANIVIVIILYISSFKAALLVNLIRIIITGLLFGNLYSILFSLTGASVSLIIMFLVKKIKGINILGTSVCGGVSHNIAQIVVASFVVDTYSIYYYIPFLIIAGVITGMIIGLISELIINKTGGKR